MLLTSRDRMQLGVRSSGHWIIINPLQVFIAYKQETMQCEARGLDVWVAIGIQRGEVWGIHTATF